MSLVSAEPTAPTGADNPAHRRPGPAARVLLALIRAYQWLAGGRPSPCRFVPSCSSYAAEAVTRHGARRGGWLALRRLGRCRPLGGSGVDLVPE